MRWIIAAAPACGFNERGDFRGRGMEEMPRGRIPVVEGYVRPDFLPVKSAFAENFTRRNELGGACCIVLNGERVVDIWGGLRDRRTGFAWQEETMAVVHSTTKGMAATAYGAFANGGRALGLRPETIFELTRPARPSRAYSSSNSVWANIFTVGMLV